MDDLISRQAAIEAIKKYDFKSPEYASYYLMRLKNAIKADLVDDINAIPPVEAEPVKHSKWIDRGKDKVMRWICPECGRKDKYIYNYCPDCGAKMDL